MRVVSKLRTINPEIKCQSKSDKLRYLDELLKYPFVCGIQLISKQGLIVSSYGDLKDYSQEQNEQFLKAFRAIALSQTEELCNKGFDLKVEGALEHFKVYHNTYCSIYAQSRKGNGGIVVCNLPYGILICHYGKHCVAGDAIKLVENFCDKLRA